MLRVGLTGGYASGKTFVASELEGLGCYVIHADELGHRVLFADGEAYQPVIHTFGAEILDANREIDRKKLAGIVFGKPELLEKLSSFVHPAVIRLEQQMLETFTRDHPAGIGVLEAAILIETGRYRDFDRIILTACDQETQIARGMKRDRLTREEIMARLENQMPLDEKRQYAHYVVNTSGSKQSTRRQIAAIFRELKHLAADETR